MSFPLLRKTLRKRRPKAASKGKELVSKGVEAAKKIVTFMNKTKTELESLLQTVEDKRDEVFTRVNENIIKLKSIIDMNAMTFSDLLKAGATKFNKENGKLSLEYIWSTSIKTTIDTLVMHMDKFMKAFSAGRSFSKRAEYSKGLMKGWVATGYAVAEAQLSGIPHLSAKARAAIGIDYHGTGQQRRGNLLELSLSPSVAIENVADIPMGLKDDIARGEEKWTSPGLKFDPPVQSLVPMLSLMGSPPVPLSSDPIKVLEAVFPHVQKRIMAGLSDTSIWFPIVASFLREHLLQVPSIRTALGGISDSLSDDEDIMNPGDDFENGELVVQRVEQKMQQMRDDICSRAEEMLSKSRRRIP